MSRSSCLAIVAVLAIFLVNGSRSSPTGASPLACNPGETFMIPQHGYDPQTSPCPFETIPLLQDDNTVRVTLVQNSVGNNFFKGYFVMGFDQSKPDSQVPIGSFLAAANDSPNVTAGNFRDCSSLPMSAATHKDNNDKMVVNLLWIPPAGFNGTVEFKTTFVQKVDTYWVRVPAVETIDIINEVTSTTTKKPDGSSGSRQEVYVAGLVALLMISFSFVKCF